MPGVSVGPALPGVSVGPAVSVGLHTAIPGVSVGPSSAKTCGVPTPITNSNKTIATTLFSLNIFRSPLKSIFNFQISRVAPDESKNNCPAHPLLHNNDRATLANLLLSVETCGKAGVSLSLEMSALFTTDSNFAG